MNTTQIKELADYCLDECGVSHLPFTIKFNNRLTAKVATAQLQNVLANNGKETKWMKAGLITIASKWWEVLDEAEKENAVIHEACHLAADTLDRLRVIREGLKGHGSFWESLHWKCGRKPERFCTRHREEVAPNSRYDVSCKNCGAIYKVTKTLITRRMNQHGSIGVCKCKTKLFPPRKYIKDMSEYQFTSNFDIWKGTSYYADLLKIRSE